MGSSFVQIGGNGFWMRDAMLELWLRLAALHLEDQVDDHSTVHTIRNEWLLASRGFFGGAVPFHLAENIATPDGRKAVVDAINSLQNELKNNLTDLQPSVLNLLGIAGKFMGHVESAQLAEVGKSMLALIDGQRFGSAADSSFEPGIRHSNS
jgi:hypothetical protein